MDIACSIDRNVPETIISNELSIRQVLLSLFDNAIKFTDRGGIDITISCRDLENETKEILFAIKDTGNGIFENEIKKLFQPFSQVDMSITRKYGGIGLGLAASKRQVELMGGKIWVESEPGRGSIFYFTVVADQPYGMPSGNSGPV